jgi:outer membrane protein
LKYVLSLILALFFLYLSAQELTGNYISLGEAKQMALEKNSSYQAQEASLEAARWSSKSTLSSVLPSVTLDGTWLYMDPAQTVTTSFGNITLNKDIRSFAFNLQQPLFLGGKIWNAYKMAGTTEKLSELTLKTKKLSVLYDVENKYLSALQLASLFNLTSADLTSANNNLQLAQLKMENGLISTADFMKFKARVASKEVSLLQAKTAYQLTLKDFSNYLGADEPVLPLELPADHESKVIDALDNLNTQQADKLTAQALAIAGSDNTALRMIDLGLELSKRAFSISKGSFLPSVVLVGSASFSENGIDRYKFENQNQLILNVSVPILPQLGNYSASRKAWYEYRKAQYEAENNTSGIKLGVESAVLSLISNAKQLKSAQLVQSYTEITYEQLQERFKLNMVSSLELLDADLMLSSARVGVSNALYAYLKSRASLQQLLNLEDAEALNTIIINISVEE